MASIDRERLRQAVKDSGRSARSISLAAGLGETAIKDILSGRSRDPGMTTLAAISGQLGLPVTEFVGGLLGPIILEATGTTRSAKKELRLAIRYEVAAGGFLERDDLPQRPYGYRRVQAVSPYTEYPQWLERVVSDSMDRLIPVGSLLHVVDAIAINYEARHDDIVIVQRSRAQGALVERTVKQVTLSPEGVQLWPRSHNPRYQGPLVVTEGAGDADDLFVEIVGLVIRSYQSFVVEPEEPDS